MSFSSSAIPITVYVAIALFFVKELLDFIKKVKAKRRELSAIKVIVSRECKPNLKCLESIEIILNNIKYSQDAELTIQIQKQDNSAYLFDYTVEYGSGSISSAMELPPVKKHYIDKFFSDSSLLDPVLFKKITRVIDNLAILEDFSIRLIEVITKKDDKNISFKARVNGFERLYTEKSIEIEEALNDLYFYCTGKELTRTLFPKC